MFIKWRGLVMLCLAVVARPEETPGLVSKDLEQDLVAEASQKDLPLPVPVYGVPESVFIDTPPGAYGPPAPVVFPSQNYEGPPPPFQKPKPVYGPPKFYPPKQTYGPPKSVYGPPKKTYGPPKLHPKPVYGVPFKPPKISYPKPFYGVPKPVYGPPKPVYGPPKVTYGVPASNVQNVHIPDLPQNFGNVGFGANVGVGSSFSTVETSIGSNFGSNFGSNIDFGANLPAPIYGTPLASLPVNLTPNFPLPTDTYGPPGLPLGPVPPNDQLLIEDFGNIEHYGPPQPDPNPRPPHPGIPAPPTPPHVLYDGWKPIPGISKPHIENVDIHVQNIQNGHIETLDEYGPPPPPPSPVLLNQNHNFQQNSNAQISSGYSSVHQDALANIDLNAIVGGDSNHIDQSKTVFEAHYTENSYPQGDLSFIQASVPNHKPSEAYGPPLDRGPVSLRQQGAKILTPPATIYGVPLSNQYGAPSKVLPANLPIPYGSVSGGGYSLHTGGNSPRHPVKFRDAVPEGLIQHIGQVSHHKDHHGHDHVKSGPAYLPPPIREVKDINQQTGNHGISNLAISIEPSHLYSLPHAGNPLNFQAPPSNLYGSPIDSYSVPLLTVSDNAASGSNTNAVAAALDGTILANLSNLEAAAILKHCPYHEAILKAAQSGEKIPADLAAKYVASLSSLGTAFQKNQHTLISPLNSFNVPATGSESVSYNSKDLSTASHSLVHTVLPSNYIDNGSSKTVRSSIQKGKSIKDESKNAYKEDVQLSNQILQTSERIRNLSEEAKQLQQKIVSVNQDISSSQFNNEANSGGTSYSVQIQSANDGRGQSSSPTIPHDQLLSEGLLQSILQAIEQPNSGQRQTNNIIQYQSSFESNNDNYQPNSVINQGLVLPEGYEPIDRTKSKDLEVQSSVQNLRHILRNEESHVHRGDIPHTECDLRADNSVTHEIIVPAPNTDTDKIDKAENDVAIYFGEGRNDDKSQETVTEISVATSISEDLEKYSKPEFGDKVKKSS
ncbi:unnamed protein product [Leptidea sinapis]|uniref:Uncharacterized protein n=1 Tax=Leptidea sinapis TaxID=189913 RepID=A0A5E4Q7E7_9NEOP|nr:unnamed protein product [Leptidea sinapis]